MTSPEEDDEGQSVLNVASDSEGTAETTIRLIGDEKGYEGRQGTPEIKKLIFDLLMISESHQLLKELSSNRPHLNRNCRISTRWNRVRQREEMRDERREKRGMKLDTAKGNVRFIPSKHLREHRIDWRLRYSVPYRTHLNSTSLDGNFVAMVIG